MSTESTQVLTTKSVILPIATMVISQIAFRAQEWIVLSADEQATLAGVLTALAIVLVRLITKRPAHLLKPKPEDS
jgi:hypothetical protein